MLTRNYTNLLILLCVSLAQASNILVWNPTISHSHVNFMGNLADVLSANGHNVTIFSPLIDPNNTSFGSRLSAQNVRFVSPKVSKGWLSSIRGTSLWESPPCTDLCFQWEELDYMNGLFLTYCEDLLEDKEMMNGLKNSKFELAYTESFDTCAPGIIQILEIKHMVLVSAAAMLPRMYEVTGLIELPSYVPGILTPYSDVMTFMERFKNFKIAIQMKLHASRWDDIFWKTFNAKYPGFPAIRDIYFEKTALVMVNVNEFAESPRPQTNMIRYIGGVALSQPKPLSEDLNKLLSEREATVLFSMGSVAQSKDMTSAMKQDIIDTFTSFPNVSFIWKYEGDDISFDSYPNIYPFKWIPQMDLLADKRLSLFITHGGMNSLMEAMHSGKPMIVVPLFGDQQLNSKNIRRRGICAVVERHELNRKTLTEAIQKTLYSKEIKRKSAFVASMLENRPQRYRSDIAIWTKVIIEHGRMEHFILHSRNFTVIQYFCLDIITCAACIVIIVVTLILWLLRRVSVVFRSIKSKTD